MELLRVECALIWFPKCQVSISYGHLVAADGFIGTALNIWRKQLGQHFSNAHFATIKKSLSEKCKNLEFTFLSKMPSGKLSQGPMKICTKDIPGVMKKAACAPMGEVQ